MGQALHRRKVCRQCAEQLCCRRALSPPAAQPSSLLRRHRLRLITTSKVCDARLREPRRSAADIVAEGDAMAGDPAIVSAAQAEIAASEARALAQPSPALAAVKRVSPLATVDAAAGGSALASGSADAGDGLSPVDRVAASLAAAAAAASAAASSAAQGVYTAAVPYAGGPCGVLFAVPADRPSSCSGGVRLGRPLRCATSFKCAHLHLPVCSAAQGSYCSLHLQVRWQTTSSRWARCRRCGRWPRSCRARRRWATARRWRR